MIKYSCHTKERKRWGRLVEKLGVKFVFPSYLIGVKPSSMMKMAAEKGDLETLIWLRDEKQQRWTGETLVRAIRFGDLEFVKTLLSMGCLKADGWAVCEAAKRGHLDIIKFLHSDWSRKLAVEACVFAALGGHLETLQWLISNGYKWPKARIGSYAAAGGNLEMYRWVVENTVHYSYESDLETAKRHGNTAIVEYIEKAIYFL